MKLLYVAQNGKGPFAIEAERGDGSQVRFCYPTEAMRADWIGAVHEFERCEKAWPVEATAS